jgi:transposase-like protein
MAHCTILNPRPRRRQAQIGRLLALALVPLLLRAWAGPGSTEVLPAPAPVVHVRAVRRWLAPPLGPRRTTPVRRCWHVVGRTLPSALLQASLLSLLLWSHRAPAPLDVLVGVPLLRWLLTLSALVWPTWGQTSCCRRLRQALADLYLAVVLGLGLALVQDRLLTAASWIAAVVTTRPPRPPKPTATGRVLDDGTYEVVLGQQFAIRHKPVDEFDRRLFLLFLRDIHLVDRPSKWPFVCQVWLAAWFGTLQELISRWEDYRAAGDWQRLMSRRDGPLLPLSQQHALIQLWARQLWWSVAEVQTQAHAHGLELSQDAIAQIGHDSGLLLARRVLRERFQLGPEQLRPKDDWLVQSLFVLLDQLQARLEHGERLSGEEQSDWVDIQTLRQELGLGGGRDRATPLPWGARLQQVLADDGAVVSNDRICCPHCGTDQVRRKSRKPRAKRYYDAQRQLQTVAVYRYYCQNPACPYQTFTNLPRDLVPYSPWRMDAHLLALQAYELGRGSYRRVAVALGMSVATAYRWVSRFGGQLLPVAALFGVVRSSGVVGVDEKWVKVPTNDKPDGKHRKWMYVYVAVDVYSYDLLHIAIFPHVGSDSARAFLLALRAKGYRPQVIVTDLNQDYGAALASVFPQAAHHECVFHALQAWHRQLREVYGTDYRAQHPEALALLKQIDRIFQAQTKRTAQRRYDRVLALREPYIAQTPAVVSVFASLERHWPKLVNAIESDHVPMTNNATELVIRRFDQHYQTFCGFNTIETAQIYLAVFEWTYRFTPFTPDAQPRIRGKCPLELAGYDVRKLPMAQICRGQVLEWPLEALAEIVPRE